MTKNIEPHLSQLPVAAYFATHDGQLLWGNSALCELLDLPEDAITRSNLADFYVHPEDRVELVSLAESGLLLEKRRVTFRVHEKEIQVQMFCRAIRGTDRTLVGLLGVLIEVTAESEYDHLFDNHLDAGVYRLDANDRVTQANARFAEIHGYDSEEEVKNKDVRIFYADPNEADLTRQTIVQEGVLRDKKVQLKRKSGEVFAAYLTAVPFINHGVYAGRSGIVQDRTREEQYERVFDDIPVGFYVVERKNGHDEVVDCNREFAKIHEVESRDAMIGRDVRMFHFSDTETEAFLKKIQDAAATGDAVLGQELRIRTGLGTVKTIEINTRPQVQNGEIIGRTGTIRDITSEVVMRNFTAALTDDLGAMLHTFRQTLVLLKHNIGAVADVLAAQPHARRPGREPQALAAAVRGPIKTLASAAGILTNAISTAPHGPALSASDLERLNALVVIMQDCETTVPNPHWRDVWRRAAVEISVICGRIRRGTIARSKYRPVIVAAGEIASVTALATLAVAREAIEEVDPAVVSLSEFVATGSRAPEQLQVCRLESCVDDALASLTGFADERRVQLRFDGSTHTYARVARRNMTRAINNLLHNAIKYSWKRDDGATWVDIKIRTSSSSLAILTIENWGVPIPQSEITTGLIFRLGVRGRFSNDRGRIGSGVGLADTYAVLQSHGGVLRVESRPAATFWQQNTISTSSRIPHLTTITIELPVSPRR